MSCRRPSRPDRRSAPREAAVPDRPGKPFRACARWPLRSVTRPLLRHIQRPNYPEPANAAALGALRSLSYPLHGRCRDARDGGTRGSGESWTMSSDRGTIHRGASAGPEQPSAWPEPTAPAGRRPPSAPRERKPVLAALAVVLILGGAVGGYYLVTQNAKRVAAIEITQQVPAGQKIPLSAMQQVEIAANSGVSYVPWNEASQVAQFYAGNAIPPGTLLNNAMVVRASNVTAGRAVLGLALKDGQLPGSLQ